jgi:hypothetical protein
MSYQSGTVWKGSRGDENEAQDNYCEMWNAMRDKIFESFLRRQYEEGMELARSSDLVQLYPMGGEPPDRYVAAFRCKGLVRGDGWADGGGLF